MCPTEGKIAFSTRRGAALAARAVLDKYGPQRPYECECGRYHLTTNPERRGVELTAETVRRLAAELK